MYSSSFFFFFFFLMYNMVLKKDNNVRTDWHRTCKNRKQMENKIHMYTFVHTKHTCHIKTEKKWLVYFLHNTFFIVRTGRKLVLYLIAETGTPQLKAEGVVVWDEIFQRKPFWFASENEVSSRFAQLKKKN